jgi:hypothetical protein
LAGSSTYISPLLAVAAKAAAKWRQGVATLAQLLLSLPAAETKVRATWACAGAAGSMTASVSAAAMKIVRIIECPLWDGVQNARGRKSTLRGAGLFDIRSRIGALVSHVVNERVAVFRRCEMSLLALFDRRGGSPVWSLLG